MDVETSRTEPESRTYYRRIRWILSLRVIVTRRQHKETAERFKVPHVYQDAHEMLDTEAIDVLYSIVPAYVRTNVEVTAAQKGIHIFSEKPQALTMQVAHRINNAIQQAGVISTVGFRERYRPIFQEARQYLKDMCIVHARFQSFGGLPPLTEGGPKTWWKRWTSLAEVPSIGVFMQPIIPAS